MGGVGEPTSRLDPITQQRTMQLLCASTAAHQWAMLLVTHDAALAERCPRQVAMRSGRIEAAAPQLRAVPA